jgi:hypothetical protein
MPVIPKTAGDGQCLKVNREGAVILAVLYRVSHLRFSRLFDKRFLLNLKCRYFRLSMSSQKANIKFLIYDIKPGYFSQKIFDGFLCEKFYDNKRINIDVI